MIHCDQTYFFSVASKLLKAAGLLPAAGCACLGPQRDNSRQWSTILSHKFAIAVLVGQILNGPLQQAEIRSISDSEDLRLLSTENDLASMLARHATFLVTSKLNGFL